MKNKKDKSFWLLVAGIACIVIYILVPLSKVIGIIDDYDAGVINIFLVAGAVFYIASRRDSFKKKSDEENTSAPEIPDADDSTK